MIYYLLPALIVGVLAAFTRNKRIMGIVGIVMFVYLILLTFIGG